MNGNMLYASLAITINLQPGTVNHKPEARNLKP